MAENYRGALVGPQFAADLKRTVDRVDGMRLSQQSTRIPTRNEDYYYRFPKATVRACTFTGSWQINEEKTIQLKYVSGTVKATNLFCGLNPTSACNAVVAKEGQGTAAIWVLVDVDLTGQPGYSNSGTHVLTVVNGVLRWTPTTVCATQ